MCMHSDFFFFREILLPSIPVTYLGFFPWAGNILCPRANKPLLTALTAIWGCRPVGDQSVLAS